VSVAAVIAVTIGALLNADPKRIVQGISRMRIAIVPLIALTFVVDCFTPLGIAVPMLYVLPVFLASLTVGVEWSMAAAVLANVLTYVGYHVSPGGRWYRRRIPKPFDRFGPDLGRRHYRLALTECPWRYPNLLCQPKIGAGNWHYDVDRLEAEVIVDGLTTYDGPSDLRVLQAAIAKALCRSYQSGRDAPPPDEDMD
jgi:hypothetical protein